MMRNPPRLILLIGIPGSGKSRWINSRLYKNGYGPIICLPPVQFVDIFPEELLVLSPDKLRKEMTSDISNQEMNTEIWEIVRNKAVEYLNKNITDGPGYSSLTQSVVIDATNVNTKYRKEFINGIITKLDPKIVLRLKLQAKIFKVNPKLASERIHADISNRIDRAKVPDENIYKMYGEFLYTLTQLKSEGFKIIRNL